MKSALRIPRLFLPNEPDEKWPVPACDAHAWDRAYWQKVEEFVGDAPSALRFVLPAPFRKEAGEEDFTARRESMYHALEEGILIKLNRGFILTERRMADSLRYGIVAAVDLEQYTYGRGEISPIRPAGEVGDFSAYLALRKVCPLEFSHAVLLYRDKRDKIVRGLLDENLEQVYNIPLRGGWLKGSFIPEEIACDVALDLQSKSEPCFLAVEGADYLAAAKAHWEEVKASLSDGERVRHPARFALAELVNGNGLGLAGVSRVLHEIDPAAFCDFFARNIKCRTDGNTVLGLTCFEADKTDELIGRYLRAEGGRVEYIADPALALQAANGEDSAAVLLGGPGNKDLFTLLKGELLPAHAVALGEDDKRFYVEGRETGYD